MIKIDWLLQKIDTRILDRDLLLYCYQIRTDHLLHMGNKSAKSKSRSKSSTVINISNAKETETVTPVNEAATSIFKKLIIQIQCIY